ncbi:hypothetical protein BVG01_30520 [Bacillus anthracis]|nr:hypothetical protein BVG01_30520 [Bacillus anthracis]
MHYDIVNDAVRSNLIALNSQTNLIYVASPINVVSVLDGKQPDSPVIATIPVGAMPVSIGADNKMNRVYVRTVNSLAVIDGSQEKLITTLSLGAGHQANIRGLAVDSTRNLVYVNSDGSSIAVVEEKAGVGGGIVATITLSAGISAIAVNPTNNRIYATHYSSNFVSVIDGDTYKVIATFSVGAYRHAIGVNPVTNFVYIGGEAYNTISVINGNLGVGGTVVATLTVPNINSSTGVMSFAVDTNHNYIYAGSWEYVISVIDGNQGTKGGEIVNQIPMRGGGGAGILGLTINSK